MKLKPGDHVILRANDGRLLSGDIIRIEITVAGPKIVALSGKSLLLVLNPDQVELVQP
jgi:hypothetical protein